MTAGTADQLDLIIQRGNDYYDPERVDNKITCADGFELSVVAHWGAYCSPRPPIATVPGEFVPSGPYTHVEVGYPSERPEPWEPVDGPECWVEYAESPERPTDTVYGQVPVAMVRALINLHGGVA